MATSTVPINHVTVVGGGVMGSGIALVTAANGYRVTVVDVNDEVLAGAQRDLEKNLKRTAMHVTKGDAETAQAFFAEAKARLSFSTDLKQTVSSTDLVIEAIVEKLDAKQNLFSIVDQAAPPHTILASNTSSLSIADIGAKTKRQDRVGGLHFFNPVPLMKLVEVVRTDRTSDRTHETLLAFGKSVRKTCITCKDTPGFVVNRLLFPVVTEALAMVERGDATAHDIDIAMKLGLGHPMGPFELMDIVGLDTVQNIQSERRLADPTKVPDSKLLADMVKQNKLGLKSGEGFYNYK